MSATLISQWNPTANMLLPKQRPGDARPDAVRFGPNLTITKGQIVGRKTSDQLMYAYGDAPVVPEIQTATKTGTWSGGTYTIALTRNGETNTTPAIAFGATAATVQAALRLLDNVGSAGVTVTGGPLSTTPMVFTFNYAEDISPLVIDVTNVTGSTPGVGIVETQKGTTAVAGTETAMAIAAMSFKTDSNSQIFYNGSTVASNDNPPSQTTFVWLKGVFDPTDLIGFDAAARTDMHAKDLPNGFVEIPG